jgi:hypothetical protein
MEGKEGESKINEKNHNKLISWLEERKLGKNLVPVLFNLGVNSVHDLKLVKEQDFGLHIFLF